MPITSISDDVAFNDEYYENGNIIVDGANFLASTYIQNSGTPEYEINQKWQSDHLSYIREYRNEDGNIKVLLVLVVIFLLF